MAEFYLSLLFGLIFGSGHLHMGGCGFCENGPREQGAIAETRLAYIKLAPGRTDRYLIVAKFHWETPADLPATWWFHVQWLLRAVDGRLDNTSQNWTPEGGRTFAHAHIWVIANRTDEEGLPIHRKGMAFMIDHAKQA